MPVNPVPIGDSGHIPKVLHYALTAPPQSVLDAGIRAGTYGFLLRALPDLRGPRVS